MTFAEQLKTMTTPQLKKLLAILEHLDANASLDFDKLLAELPTLPAVSKSDPDLVGARVYELMIYEGLDANFAHKQALEEFEVGQLTRKPIPRRRPRAKTAATDAEAAATSANPRALSGPRPQPENAPAAAATDPATVPDNVIPTPTKLKLDNFHSKFFHNPSYSVW